MLTVDMRMARSSGIGTYLREVVPRVLARSGRDGALLGIPSDLAELENPLSTRLVRCTAPIYSIREQIELPLKKPAGTTLFWSPHYNIPLLHTGPLVTTIHDVLHLARPEFVRGAHQRAYARSMLRAVSRKSAAIICDSAFTADEMRRLLQVSSRKLHVVHLGVDSAWFGAGPGVEPPEKPYFVYVGNIKPHKNVHRLVKAFRSIADRIPHDLLIVGRQHGFITGDARASREAELAGDRIRFTGLVSDAAVRGFVAGAQALVSPSLYEGFGLPALEAMAAGCPVIASRAASLPEVCGGAALYVDPESEQDIAEAMLRIAKSPTLRGDLSKAGRNRAQSFSWDRCATETEEILRGSLPR